MAKIEFEDSELELLIQLVNDRIIEADADGIPRTDSSSVFREQLFNKLMGHRPQRQVAPAPFPEMNPKQF